MKKSKATRTSIQVNSALKAGKVDGILPGPNQRLVRIPVKTALHAGVIMPNHNRTFITVA